jgi:hypothetical protein
MKPQYKFYASLFDSFDYYLSSESDTAEREFIDKINRVPFESEPAERGTAFNDLVDKIANDNTIQFLPSEDVIIYPHKSRTGKDYSFMFNKALTLEFALQFIGASRQVFCVAQIETKYGAVELYGYIDELLYNMAYDIKTTGNYTFPKFSANWQHRIYPFCLEQMGVFVDGFEYTVTDFSNLYREYYPYLKERYQAEIRAKAEQMIEFLENERIRPLITDKKIFGLEK